ncbi:MAG: hypothetical protein D6753_12675 [Planctomycetota bacterium]|nr:MAG: hypothetical protein D6753_12675 [Planctomycetota bacterium]
MVRATAALLGACFLWNCPAVADTRIELGGGIHLRWIAAPQPTFVLEGVPHPSTTAPQAYFEIVSRPDESSDVRTQPAMLGRYEVQGNTIRFTARYASRNRAGYVVRIGPALQRVLPTGAPATIPIEPGEQKTAPTARVTAVYPSADILPENLLKFYIHFSQPMSRGRAYDWIELYEGDRKVEMPFLELGEELWDPQQQRFTLFLHPGRLKRGVRPNEELGPPLTAGRQYTLRINSSWQDANGLPLQSGYEKHFTVGPPDRQQLNPEDWKIETPRAGTRQPVAIVFNEPLDHAMLERVLVVKHQTGNTIDGEIQVLDGETRWEFAPAVPWKTGTYFVEVAANLEDLCGNSIARPFEVKLQDRVAANPQTRIAIEFIVK